MDDTFNEFKVVSKIAEIGGILSGGVQIHNYKSDATFILNDLINSIIVIQNVFLRTRWLFIIDN